MKKTIAFSIVLLLCVAGLIGCEQVPGTNPSTTPATDLMMPSPTEASGLTGYLICPDCLKEFESEEALAAHPCAQDAIGTERLQTLEQSLAVIANLFEVEGLSYPVDDVVNDYAQSYLFIYANLFLSDRAAEMDAVENEAFRCFISISEEELASILDAAFGSRFTAADLSLGEYSPICLVDGTYYIGAGDVIGAECVYQGVGALGETETQEYLYLYRVSLLDDEIEGAFSVEVKESESFPGSLSIAGV